MYIILILLMLSNTNDWGVKSLDDDKIVIRLPNSQLLEDIEITYSKTDKDYITLTTGSYYWVHRYYVSAKPSKPDKIVLRKNKDTFDIIIPSGLMVYGSHIIIKPYENRCIVTIPKTQIYKLK